MSLVRIAARIAAVEALKGKTLVGDNVLDSEIGGLDIQSDGSLRGAAEKPYIAVYSDAGKASGDANALRALTNNGATDFLFEVGITTAMTETNDQGESVLLQGIPATDRALEFFLDMVCRQIGDALTDPGNEWAEIFRILNTGIVSVDRNRTSSDVHNARMAMQQLAIKAGLINDPSRGTVLAPTHGLSKFFAKAATITVPNPDFGEEGEPVRIPDPVVAAQVALMQAAIAGTPTSYNAMLQRYARTASEGAATGEYPMGGTISEMVLP